MIEGSLRQTLNANTSVAKQILLDVPTMIAAGLHDFFGAGTRTVIKSLTDQWYNSSEIPIGKSIALSHQFLVTMVPTPALIGRVRRRELGVPPIIRSWHVRDISIPQFDFTRDVQMWGPIPRSWGTVAYEKLGNITINFVEDMYGSIRYFSQYLKHTIIDPLGYTIAPNMQKTYNIICAHYGTDGYPIEVWGMKNCYFAGDTGDIRFSYEDSGQILHTIRFGADDISYFNTGHLIQMLMGKQFSTGIGLGDGSTTGGFFDSLPDIGKIKSTGRAAVKRMAADQMADDLVKRGKSHVVKMPNF